MYEYFEEKYIFQLIAVFFIFNPERSLADRIIWAGAAPRSGAVIFAGECKTKLTRKALVEMSY